MATPDISIPPEYADELRYVELKDTRSDAEIIASFQAYVPIKSEKNIWTFWHEGFHDMPPWCRRNVVGWARLHGPEWTVRVLDTVPGSKNHALQWISAEDLPKAFVDDRMTGGSYSMAHSADFLRGPALYRYGGVWMDVGILMFRTVDRMCWDQLADDTSPYTVCVPWMFEQHMANHFTAARKGDQFIKNWYTVFNELWKDRTDHHGIALDPLVSFIQSFDFSQSEARGFKWKFAVEPLTVMSYLGQCLAWIRCVLLKEPNGGFDGVEYYANKVLLFEVLTEDWSIEATIGFNAKDLVKVFATRRDSNPESKNYKMAEKCAWRMLARSCMQKISHGKGLTQEPAPGILLEQPENEDVDHEPGTFGELLRYGALHFEQTRTKINYVAPVLPEEHMIIRKGLLER